MSAWSQVFDDGTVLLEARRHARRLLIGFALVSGALVSLAPLVTVWGRAHAGVVVLACGALLSASAAVVLVRLARIHRRWCRFEISTMGIAATDTAGRRTALLWRTASGVDLSDDGLRVVSVDLDGRPVVIEARQAMAGFDALARRALDCAHAYRLPLTLDGCPVDELSLAPLTASETRTRRGGSAEPAG